jgi:hypothetical protein
MRCLRPEVLLKGSVLQAQCLSFRIDKLTFMSKARYTIPEQARRALWLGAAVKATGNLISKRGNLRSACKASLDSAHCDFCHQFQMTFLNCHFINISNF